MNARSIHRRRALAALLCPVFLALGGCSSVWQRAYRPSPLSMVSEPLRYPAERPVLVREAPWPRVEAALKRLQEEEAASDIHVSQWPDEQRLEATGRLLKALQLQDDPRDVVLLGSASFTTTDTIRPGDGSLEAMARRLGADYAIWTSRYLGQGTRVVDKPVTIHRHGWGRYYDRGDRAWRDRYYSDIDTAWVPIVVQADRFAYIAFFVRRTAP